MIKSNFVFAVIAAASLASCTPNEKPSAAVASAPKRELTPTEQASLGHQIAIRLKDPSSAAFQWPKVILIERNGITDYCGFVNSKNSYGGYGGFSHFYAQLQKGPDGSFQTADLRLIAESSDDVSQYATTASCSEFGYGADQLH